MMMVDLQTNVVTNDSNLSTISDKVFNIVTAQKQLSLLLGCYLSIRKGQGCP
jgi:hypothetical protein